jgi:hypothetical protein
VAAETEEFETLRAPGKVRPEVTLEDSLVPIPQAAHLAQHACRLFLGPVHEVTLLLLCHRYRDRWSAPQLLRKGVLHVTENGVAKDDRREVLRQHVPLELAPDVGLGGYGSLRKVRARHPVSEGRPLVGSVLDHNASPKAVFSSSVRAPMPKSLSRRLKARSLTSAEPRRINAIRRCTWGSQEEWSKPGGSSSSSPQTPGSVFRGYASVAS